MKVTTLGIDLAKNVFQLHGVDERGKVVLSLRVTRGRLLEVMANLPSCVVGMEACIGANYWAREFEKLGHTVKLMSPQFVKPYVKTNKNDGRDAEGICEAVSRPSMRFVPVKTVEQQDIQALHRSRSLLMKNRTALSNQIRGLLSEYGLVIAKSPGKVRRILPTLLDDEGVTLSPFARETFRDLYHQLVDLDQRLEKIEERLQRLFEAHPVCQRIAAIPGIGPLTATALLAAINNPQLFRNGRHMAAWLGLVPRQYSSGEKVALGGISKRGNCYMRTLLIHGARSVVMHIGKKKDPLSLWIRALKDRSGTAVAAVALANKNARVIWALLAHNDVYRKAA
jgi:transposase